MGPSTTYPILFRSVRYYVKRVLLNDVLGRVQYKFCLYESHNFHSEVP